MESKINQALLILASGSPRRVELLTQLGWRFRQQSADIDESQQAGETPEALVCRLAEQKALAVDAASSDGLPVLGSDTIVVIDGQVLGKPQDQADATRMLSLLSDRWHQVMTAVSLVIDGQATTELVCTEVKFCSLSLEQISHYYSSGEPKDKAGSYAIQGIGGNFVERINGSYSAVVGLPLVETQRLLSSHLEEL